MKILAGVFLGWSLGANNSANVFGTAVSSQMVRWRTAAILIAVFALLGALLEGERGLETYRALATASPTASADAPRDALHLAFCTALAAALTTTLMTIAKLPVSTSQAVVGGVLAGGMYHGEAIFAQPEKVAQLTKVVICWVGTPVAAALIAMLFYPLLARLLRRVHLHFFTYDRFMRALLVGAGIYGAYTLGANNVANATGVFYGAGAFKWMADATGFSEVFFALAIGGVSIGFGAITYSKSVMATVGKSIIPLDAFSAFVVVLSEAVTVHICTLLGVPVSTSQAVVGAVLGIGIFKGMRTVKVSSLVKIGVGWILTPVFGGALTVGLLWVW